MGISRPAVLGYVVANYPMDSSMFAYSIGDLGIGTYGRVFTGTTSSPLHALLAMCMSKGIAALPITDEDGVLVDMFSRYDVMHIAAEANTMDSSIMDINPTFSSTQLFVCSRKDSLRSVLQHMMQTSAQRLVCVNEHKRVEGVITVGDIFNFFIQYVKDEEASSPKQSDHAA
eukprot:NODE_5634_length_562_cov_56.787524_g4900_i0.p1 GENE.NODE_5634_length_562_cov_56.787524_g4900_i0~~NODE_5634_length_562_cov_56.787524_g4900_i0.p1  ORF type:complete len:180 (-),score=66.54 NODE_5634_length_562_cov_56.787524_g4900_i0:22-537(-)